MEWSITYSPELPFVRIVTRGSFNPEDQRRMNEAILTSPFWQPGMHTLFDHRNLDFGGTGYAGMIQARGNHIRHNERIGDGKAALLMGTMDAFGVARQFEMLSEGQVLARLRVFKDEAEALAWLTGGPLV
ncbi:MAG: hypothetical protein HS116_00865 [Planctomycetes bacterium]|nr:hypothetical protein [Planctomycetota bacterium]